MKENKNLEKQFKDSLKDLEVGPPDGAKGAIEKNLIDAGLLKEKNETRGGVWMFVLLILLVAAPLILLLKKNNKSSKQVVEQTAVRKDSLNILNNETNKNNNSPDEKQLDKTQDRQVNTNEKNRNTDYVSEATAGIEKGIKKKLKKGKGASEGIMYTEVLKEKNASSISGNKKEKVKKEKSAQSKEAIEFAEVITPASHVETKENVKDATEKENATDANNSASAIIEAASAMPPNSSEAGDTSTTALQAENEKPLEKDALLKKSLKDSTEKTKSPPLPKEKGYTHVAFDFSGGQQFNYIKYGSGAITNNETYIEQSRESEKTTPSFSAAFGIVLTLQHLIVETGLRHSTLSSNFSYSETYSTIDTSHSYADTSGQWIHIEDTVKQQTHYIATNEISFLEFPVLMGYGFQAAKFTVELKAGVLIGYITTANTTNFSLNTGDVVRYNELSNSPYRKTNWSALVSANVLYPIGGRFSVFAQPSMKYGLNSIFKDNYSVTKKIQSLTLGLGLRIRL